MQGSGFALKVRSLSLSLSQFLSLWLLLLVMKRKKTLHRNPSSRSMRKLGERLSFLKSLWTVVDSGSAVALAHTVMETAQH